METNILKQLYSLCSIPDGSLQSDFESSAQLGLVLTEAIFQQRAAEIFRELELCGTAVQVKEPVLGTI